MKKHFKKSIVLSIVPVFVLAGCSNNEDQVRLVVPNNESEVVVNDDGSYSQEVAAIDENSVDAAPGGEGAENVSTTSGSAGNDQKLLDSYNEAKANGYTGSMDDWIALVQLHETNPEEAQAKAEESGFSGGAMIMGALAGAAVGAMLASSSNSRSGLASSSYSAQRYNNTNNYAYSRPKDEQQSSSSGGGYVGRGGSTAAAVAGSSNTVRSGSTASGSSNTVKSTPSHSASTKTTSSYSSSRPTASYSSVSRGGFGGAVSSGG